MLPIATVLWPLRATDPRPVLSGPEEITEVGRYRIHATTEGQDAASAELVAAVGPALEAAEASYLAEGWRPLQGDIDVYLRQIDAFGYATPVDDGDACFIQLDADLSPLGQLAQSVATHELHHCVQFRYSDDLAPWIYEAQATYEQYTTVEDPGLALAYGALYVDRLGSPERPLAATDGRFEYAGFLWAKFWSERGPGTHPERLPRLWEAMAGASRWQPTMDEAAEAEFGRSLEAVFTEHALWNTFACLGDDGRHYDEAVLPCAVGVEPPVEAWDGAPIEIVHEDGPFTSAAFEAPATDEAVTVTCAGEGVWVGLAAMDATGALVEIVGEGSVTTLGLGGPLRVVVAGTGPPLEATCEASSTPLPLSGCATTGGGPWLLALTLSRRRRTGR